MMVAVEDQLNVECVDYRTIVTWAFKRSEGLGVD
jgi:hypothetical protein